MTPAYDVQGIRKTYENGRVVANNNVTLQVAQGEVFGLLGPNGAGKSTLVHQMVGLLRPDAGSIHLLGHDLRRHARIVPHTVSFLGQQPLALRELRVREAVAFTGQLRGLAPVEASRQADALLEELDLAGAAGRLVGRLSGGQRRLAGIAAALIGERPVLVLDEPTAGVDPALRRTVWRMLRDRARLQGTTVLLVTHDVLEAERVVDRVAVLLDGQVAAEGTPTELQARTLGQVRLEVSLRNDGNGLMERLAALGTPSPLGAGRWTVLLAPDRVRQATDLVLGHLDGNGGPVEGFQVLRPSLEDVYLALRDSHRAD